MMSNVVSLDVLKEVEEKRKSMLSDIKTNTKIVEERILEKRNVSAENKYLGLMSLLITNLQTQKVILSRLLKVDCEGYDHIPVSKKYLIKLQKAQLSIEKVLGELADPFEKDIRSSDRADKNKINPPTEDTTNLVKFTTSSEHAVREIMVTKRNKVAKDAIAAEEKIAEAIRIRKNNLQDVIAAEEKFTKAITMRENNLRKAEQLFQDEEDLFNSKLKACKEYQEEYLKLFDNESDHDDGNNGKDVKRLIASSLEEIPLEVELTAQN